MSFYIKEFLTSKLTWKYLCATFHSFYLFIVGVVLRPAVPASTRAPQGHLHPGCPKPAGGAPNTGWFGALRLGSRRATTVGYSLSITEMWGAAAAAPRLCGWGKRGRGRPPAHGSVSVGSPLGGFPSAPAGPDKRRRGERGAERGAAPPGRSHAARHDDVLQQILGAEGLLAGLGPAGGASRRPHRKWRGWDRSGGGIRR